MPPSILPAKKCGSRSSVDRNHETLILENMTMQLKAKLGIAPIAWSNDDLPQLGGDTPLETCLSESRLAGFSGVETGGKFPKSSAELRPLLQKHGLGLVSGWYSGTV